MYKALLDSEEINLALNNIENLNAVQLDTLKEIGNIGQGNAASALSDMMGKFVDVSVPDVRLLNFEDTVNYLGGAENTVIGIVFTLSGDISGMLLQVLEESVARSLICAVTGSETADLSKFNDMDISCLQELGNILAGSYINAPRLRDLALIFRCRISWSIWRARYLAYLPLNSQR